jgi:hypothetical protein
VRCFALRQQRFWLASANGLPPCLHTHTHTHTHTHSSLPSHRLGLRSPLGSDARGRRYWALGGAAGAWRLFVEDKEGQLWVRVVCHCTEHCMGGQVVAALLHTCIAGWGRS